MTPAEAIAAVSAAQVLLPPQSYEATPAPTASMHEGLWYVSERNGEDMPTDDCVWIVFADGFVARGIPVGNPINPPTQPDDLRRRRKDLNDPEAPWNQDTVSHADAESEVAKSPLTLYPYRGDWFTQEEFADWVSGGLSLYQAVEVRLAIATEFTNGTHRWTKDQLHQCVFPRDPVADRGFGDWLASALEAGELQTVEFLQYIAEGYGDGDEDGKANGVVMERRIVDASRPIGRNPQ